MASKSCKALCGIHFSGTDQSTVGEYIWLEALVHPGFEELHGSLQQPCYRH